MMQTPTVDGNFLLEVITKATSQNPIYLKDAENTIHQLEVQPGYSVNLLVSSSGTNMNGTN